MPGYSTITGENASTVTMAATTSLFRKLLSIGNGFTITGWDLDLYYGGPQAAATTGLTVGQDSPDLQLKYGLAYGPTTFTPAALVGNPDQAGMLWYESGVQQTRTLVVPATTTSQFQDGWRMRVSSRYQFRLGASSDFCLLIGNNSAAANQFSFTATLRVSYA